MKFRLIVITIALALFVQGALFAQAESPEIEYAALVDQVNAFIDAGEYTAAASLLKRIHELKPQELHLVEYLGSFYLYLPEERPEVNNALFWFLEAERLNSTNNMVYYNLACVYSLRSDLENAVQAMNKALVFGFSDFVWMGQDEDLVNFRASSWWQGIEDHIQIHEQLALVRGIQKCRT